MSYNLGYLSDEALDEVLTLDIDKKVAYFSLLVDKFYPKVEKESEDYQNLLESYASSFYVEKLYRSNRFFSEKFTPVYTTTGLIRNITLDLYFIEEELLIH